MRVFKPTYKDKNGKKKQGSAYYVEFKNRARDCFHKVPGYTDKQLTLDLGRRLERLSGFIASRQAPDADLAAWENGYGITGTAEHHQGDANGDMNVDGADFLEWQSQFTGSLPLQAVSTAVPEPSTGILLLWSLAIAAASRRGPANRL